MGHIKMKTILAENMLRFGTKNINESADLTQKLREKIWNSKLALESLLEFIHSEHIETGSYPKDTHVNLNIEQQDALIDALNILSRLYTAYEDKFPQ